MEFLKLITLYTFLILIASKLDFFKKYLKLIFIILGFIFFFAFFYPKNMAGVQYFGITLFFMLGHFLLLTRYKPKTQRRYLAICAYVIMFFLCSREWVSSFNWGLSYISIRLIWLTAEEHDGLLKEKISLANYLNYLFFFPTAFNGPLYSYNLFTTQIENIKLFKNNHFDSFLRFTWGLAKFFIFSTVLQPFLPSNLLLNGYSHGLFEFFFSLSCLYLYIYFNFSGAIDIVISCSKFLGFSLPENFNNPFKATNISQFWNCWHITLTQFLKLHIFIPIVKSITTQSVKLKIFSIYLASASTLLTMALSHGISNNLIIYGLSHAIGMSIYLQYDQLLKPANDFIKNLRRTRLYLSLCWLLTHGFIAINLLFFSYNLDQIRQIWSALVFNI